MSKQARQDLQRTKLTYRHDRVTGQTTLKIDVEVPEDDMPHEHRQSLTEMAEELTQVPLRELEAMGATITLKRPDHGAKHTHTNEKGEEVEHEHEAPRLIQKQTPVKITLK